MARKTVEIVPTPAGLSGYVAELGSAYLCAQLGVTPIARADHAQYLAHWLNVMKEDRKAIFTAASQADKAARYLLGFHTPAPNPSPPTRPALARHAADATLDNI